MVRKPNIRMGAAARAVVAVGTLAAAAWSAADSGSDRFDRQVEAFNRQLHIREIVVDPSVPATPPRAPGAEGRAADTVLGEQAMVDTGSSQFNSYVAQLNEQLRIREQAPGQF